MEKNVRSIQRTGSSSYTVSIPSEWVEAVFSEDSLEVAFYREGSTLMMTQNSGEKHESYIKREDASTTIRELIRLYTAGYERIVIDVSEASMEGRRRVKDFIMELMGMTILEEGDDEMVVQDILDIPEFPPEDTVRRSLNIATSAVDVSVDAYLNGDSVSLHDSSREMQKLWYLNSRICSMMFYNPSRLEDMDLNATDTMRGASAVRELYGVVQEAIYISDAGECWRAPEPAPEVIDDLMDTAQEALSESVKYIFEDVQETDGHRAGGCRYPGDRTMEDLPDVVSDTDHSSMDTDEVRGMVSVSTSLYSIHRRARSISELV